MRPTGFISILIRALAKEYASAKRHQNKFTTSLYWDRSRSDERSLISRNEIVKEIHFPRSLFESSILCIPLNEAQSGLDYACMRTQLNVTIQGVYRRFEDTP